MEITRDWQMFENDFTFTMTKDDILVKIYTRQPSRSIGLFPLVKRNLLGEYEKRVYEVLKEHDFLVPSYLNVMKNHELSIDNPTLHAWTEKHPNDGCIVRNKVPGREVCKEDLRLFKDELKKIEDVGLVMKDYNLHSRFYKNVTMQDGRIGLFDFKSFHPISDAMCARFGDLIYSP